MTLHFTMDHSQVLFDREFRFSKEFGDRIGVSSSGEVLTRLHQELGYRGTPRGNGYLGVTVQGKSVLVHRMVYELFSSRIPDGLQIDHIDGSRDNNAVSNLRVATPHDNACNPVTWSRSLPSLRRNMAKAIAAKSRPVLQVETGTVFPSIQAAGRAVCRSPMCVYNAIRRQGRSAGFHWRFANV